MAEGMPWGGEMCKKREKSGTNWGVIATQEA